MVKLLHPCVTPESIQKSKVTKSDIIWGTSLAIRVKLWFWTETSIGHNVNPGEITRNLYRDPDLTLKVAIGVFVPFSVLPKPLINILSALFLPVSLKYEIKCRLMQISITGQKIGQLLK